MDEDNKVHAYQKLTPDTILNAVDSQGYRCDGRLLALNSYENRVYQIGIDDDTPVIVKFYRPDRWSRKAILEEHSFAWELATQEIPVIAPYKNADNQTLNNYEGFMFAVYPRSGGRWPDLDRKEDWQLMGRFLGRIHAVGATRHFQHRTVLDVKTLGDASRDYLLGSDIIPDYLTEAYATLTADLLASIRIQFAATKSVASIRLHGDCHPGNILWSETGPHFVDLDDARTGPAIQDIWMLLSGDADDMRTQLDNLLEGYETFYDFDYASIHLIEALRTLRIMNYAAWLARRWDDPAFPQAFPWFDSPRYWEEHILSLREQAAALADSGIR